MKFPTLASSLVLISVLGLDGIRANDSSPSLRGSNEYTQQRRALRMQRPCTLVRVETQYEYQLEENFEANRARLYNGSGDGGRRLEGDDDILKCELEEEDREAVGKYFVPVNGIDASQLDSIVSGDTTILAEGATIMDGEMYLPADASIEFGSNGRRLQQQNRREGVKKVLVVRADARGSSTTASKQTLSDKIFGTNGDISTLKSQYLECSHGKLDLQPFEGMTRGGTTIEGGVMDVTIDMQVPGASRYAVEDALEQAADQMVGGLRGQFDHIMLCLPPGTVGGQWIAYGYINSWISVYNDNFCKSMSTQVHEIGHNLGLAHSAKDGVSYGDKSGMMGFSYNRDNGPFQCFNPAKTYQLGWFDDKHIEVDPMNEGTWTGTIIGATDYSNDLVDQSAGVIVRIKTGTSRDLFVGYNRKKWMNSGVLLSGDRVTVIEQGVGYSESDFVASLSPTNGSSVNGNSDSTKVFNNFGGSGRNLVVEFVDRGTRFDEANIAIYFDTCVFPSCCEGPNCSQLINNPPLQLVQPTVAPTFAPTTTKPTMRPTPFPTTRKPTTAPQEDFSIEYNNNQSPPAEPKELLNEYFRDGLGYFYNTGATEVTREIYEYVLTARFPLQSPSNVPSIDTAMYLQGTSTIKVTFWYNAERMRYGEGFKLQYAAGQGSSWTDINQYNFGEGDFNAVNKWHHAVQETFQVPPGTTTAQIRIVGFTERPNSDSVFHIAGVTVSGQ